MEIAAATAAGFAESVFESQVDVGACDRVAAFTRFRVGGYGALRSVGGADAGADARPGASIARRLFEFESADPCVRAGARGGAGGALSQAGAGRKLWSERCESGAAAHD